MLVKGWIIVEHTSVGYRTCALRMQHVALVQRSANVRGLRDVGKTLAQLVSAGWVVCIFYKNALN